MARAQTKRKPPVLAVEFGNRLREFREERGMTQRELAEKLHVHVPAISRYETGVCLPNAETLVELAGVLRINIDVLLLGRNSDNPVDESLIKDLRLLERVRELEKLDRHYRDTAVAVLDALIVQGNQDAVKLRLAGSGR